MATPNSTAAPEATTPQARTVLFTPFTWHFCARRDASITVDGGRVAAFAGGVRDVSAGVRHVMQMIERDDIDEASADEKGDQLPAMLSVQHKADLLRLCTWALGKLEADSSRMVEYLDEQAGK